MPRPEVEVTAESVTDAAGNAIGEEDAITAKDGIPAKLTVTVTGSGGGARPVTDEAVAIMIESDERLAGNPRVTLRQVGDNYGSGN